MRFIQNVRMKQLMFDMCEHFAAFLCENVSQPSKICGRIIMSEKALDGKRKAEQGKKNTQMLYYN